MNIIPVGFYLGRHERKNLFFLVLEGMYFTFWVFFRGGRLFLLTAILQLDYVYGVVIKSNSGLIKVNSGIGTPIEQNFM